MSRPALNGSNRQSNNGAASTKTGYPPIPALVLRSTHQKKTEHEATTDSGAGVERSKATGKDSRGDGGEDATGGKEMKTASRLSPVRNTERGGSPPATAAGNGGGGSGGGERAESPSSLEQSPPGNADTTGNTTAVRVTDLPEVLQRIIAGSSRKLTQAELRNLSRLPTERRCAAIGMECEGYAHDTILGYLLPAGRPGQPGYAPTPVPDSAKRPVYRPASPRKYHPSAVAAPAASTTSPSAGAAASGPSGSRPTTPVNSRPTTPRGHTSRTEPDHQATASGSTTPRSFGVSSIPGTTSYLHHGGLRPISPGRTLVHVQIAQQEKLVRQGSESHKRQEREKLRIRTHYDARREVAQEVATTPKRTATPNARGGQTPRGGGGPSNDSRAPTPISGAASQAHQPAGQPQGPYWQRARTPGTPRRTDGSRVPPPKAFGETSHRVSYLSPEVQMASARTKINLESHGIDPQILKIFKRSESSIMAPPPKLRPATKHGSEEPGASPAPKDPAAGRKENSEEPPAPCIVVTAENENGSDAGGGKYSRTNTGEGSVSSSVAMAAANENDPLLAVSNRRVEKWVDDFQSRLRSMRIQEGDWVRLTDEQQQELFTQWRMPQLQRKVLQIRYPHAFAPTGTRVY